MNKLLSQKGQSYIGLLLAAGLALGVGGYVAYKVVPKYIENIQKEQKNQKKAQLPPIPFVDYTKKVACRTNIRNINAAVEFYFRDIGRYPTEDLSDIGRGRKYFPKGLPVCPITNTKYRLDKELHVVINHEHNDIQNPAAPKMFVGGKNRTAEEIIKFTQKSTCRHNIQIINKAIDMWYTVNSEWPKKDLSDIARDRSFFPQGLPRCPVDNSKYVLDTESNTVFGHEHRNIQNPFEFSEKKKQHPTISPK